MDRPFSPHGGPEVRTRASVAWLAVPLVGCLSPSEAYEDADREVYEIIRGLRDDFSSAQAFTIEPEAESLRSRMLAGEVELEPLTLVECLRIAAENNRDYQTERENLYLTALDLTLARWDFSVQETGSFGAFMTGGANAPTTVTTNGGLGIAKLFSTGLSMIGDLSFGLVRDISRGDAWEATTNASLSITQPLLRGFGRDIVLEPLTQAERNVVYEARAYDRFRRTFSFDVASRFYRIVQQVDVLENTRQNEISLGLFRERNEAFAEAGRLNDIQLDQARQEELRARNSVIEVNRTLEALLDDYKLFLGLPVEADLSLDTTDRPTLDTYDALLIEFTEEAVIDVALELRLDYQTTLDRVEDAERRVRIAADDLRAGLDLGVDVDVGSEVDEPFRYDRDTFDAQVGLGLDLPIDRKRERNAYRESLIVLDQSLRRAAEQADTIRADLRDSLRRMAASRESYEIQVIAVSLAEKRVESAKLNFEAGRIETRDVLDAQNDLLANQNDAAARLTDYILSGLALYRDMELVRVTDAGVEIDTEPLIARLAEDMP